MNLSIKYIGLSFGVKFKEISMRNPVINRFELEFAGWRRGLLSRSEKVTLIKSALANVPIYMMSLLQYHLA